MIGDSDVDVMTAKAAHVPIILVSFGYATTPLAELKAEATSIISTNSMCALQRCSVPQ
jgi:phosphoglycolate phosphatase-like HAD superfamily hydrolase